MTDTYLLDTHAAIWATEGGALSKPAVAVLEDASEGAACVKVSPITAWEVGLLVAKGRLTMRAKPSTWFDGLCRLPGVALAALDGDILIDSSFLPGKVQGDPADRIIIATARAQGLTILTRDRQILEYAKQGHVMALEC
jgi:PIN domain nuclease of toxin-antitoxin system